MAEDLTPLPRPRHPGNAVLHRKRLPRHHRRRTLGVPALFAEAYGHLGAPVYYLLGLTALHALALMPLAFALSVILFILTAITYAESAAALPEGGGTPALARRAFNDLVGFIAGWMLLLAYTAGIAISTYVAVHYLGALLPFLEVPTTRLLLTGMVIAALAIVNSIRSQEPLRLYLVASALNLGTQAIVVTAGLVLLFDMQTVLDQARLVGALPTWSSFLVAVALSMLAYIGIEVVSDLVEEARSPARVVPRSVLFVALAVLGVYIPSALVALNAMPMAPLSDSGWHSDLLGDWQSRPFVGIVNAFSLLLRTVLAFWVPLLATLALVVAAHANVHSLMRLAHAMGQRRQLPLVLSRVPARFRSPVGAVAFCSLMALALVVPGRLHLLADALAFAALSVFALAHASILALCHREPTLVWPYRASPTVRIGDHAFPLTAVLGLALTLLLWATVLWLRPEGRWLGLGWLGLGLVIYAAYRTRQGLPLASRRFSPEPPTTPVGNRPTA